MYCFSSFSQVFNLIAEMSQLFLLIQNRTKVNEDLKREKERDRKIDRQTDRKLNRLCKQTSLRNFFLYSVMLYLQAVQQH